MKTYFSARNVILGSTFVALLMVLGLANPSDTFAKAKADAKAHVSAQVEVDDDNGSCLKAFGHLVAPGWIKKHGQPNISEDCALPPGIFKKIFGGGNGNGGNGGGGNPNDTVAPVISNIDSSAEDDEAVIIWTTNEKADSTVFYSTISPVNINDAGTPRESDNDRVLSHEIELDDLAASTTYYAIVTSKDASGNIGTSSQFSFTTDADDGDDDDDEDPIISDIVIERGTTTATVSWSTDENADSAVFYATSSSVDINDPETDVVMEAGLSQDHEIELSGLQASTTYYIVIRSRDADSNQSVSSELSFTTLAAEDDTAPVISNIILIIGSSTAQVTWMTDEPASSKVFYSSSTPVDVNASSTLFVEDATLELSHDLMLSALSADTDYYIVIQSEDAAGNVKTSGEFGVHTAN